MILFALVILAIAITLMLTLRRDPDDEPWVPPKWERQPPNEFDE